MINDYNATLQIYSDLVQEMRDLIEMGLEAEVDVLSKTCRVTWEAVERARVALYRHEADHNCKWMYLTREISG